MDLIYVACGLAELEWHGMLPGPSNVAADIAGILVLAVLTAACFGWLAGIAGHRPRVWVPLAFLGSLFAGVLSDIVVALAFAVAVFAAIPTRPLTAEEEVAVEPMPGVVGTSWYVRGRAYWGSRIVVVTATFWMLVLGVVLWVNGALAIATPPDRGLLGDLLPPPFDPLLPFKEFGLVVVCISSNAISALLMWASLNHTDYKLLALPEAEPLPWPRFRPHYGPRPLVLLALPFVLGAVAVVLVEYCRRQTPSERVLRTRAEKRLLRIREGGQT